MTWLERICAVHDHSERPAVIGDERAVSGRELIGKSVTAADLLVDLDVQPGQPIPGLLTTNADALAFLFAGAAANRPLAPLGPRQTTAELSEMVRRSGSPVLIAEPAFAKTAREVAEAVGIRAVTIPSLPESRRPLHLGPGSTAVFLHTAGTTGSPKRSFAHRSGARCPRRAAGTRDRDRARRPLRHRLTAASHRAVWATSWWLSLPGRRLSPPAGSLSIGGAP